MQPKVSVIIPVYKAERYIEKCAESLFNQTLEEIEFIFVNDCTPDNSIEKLKTIIAKYPERQIKLIDHSINMGVSSSRQSGLNVVTGEYVIHCDPDDWVELDIYESLYNAGKKNNSDIVICDNIVEYANKSKRVSLKLRNSTDYSFLRKLVNGSLHGGLCNKLVKHNFIKQHNISFHPFLNICEDLIFCINLGKYNPIITYLPKALYHYDKFSNPNSLTLLANPHNKIQYKIWQDAFNKAVPDAGSRLYATGYCYIAYWAFTHNILSKEEYRKVYRDKIKYLMFNDRNIFIRLITSLSALGFKETLYKLYKKIKHL